MKKLLILLAALSLVACSSNEPKEDMTETTPVVTEVVVVEETPVVMEKAPMVGEEDIINGESQVIMENNSMEEEVIVEETPMSYTVVEGDNLFKIGLQYNMSWEKLVEENNISNPDVIEIGQVITIPAE